MISRKFVLLEKKMKMYKYSHDFSFRAFIQKYHDIKSYLRHKIYKLSREDVLVNDKYCKDNHTCRYCRSLIYPARLSDENKQKLYDEMANSVRPHNGLPIDESKDIILKVINKNRRRLFENEYKNWN